MEGTTGVEVRQQRQTLNYLIAWPSSRSSLAGTADRRGHEHQEKVTVSKVFVTGLAGESLASTRWLSLRVRTRRKTDAGASRHLRSWRVYSSARWSTGPTEPASRQVRAITRRHGPALGAAQALGFRLDGYERVLRRRKPDAAQRRVDAPRHDRRERRAAATTAPSSSKRTSSRSGTAQQGESQQAIKRIELQVGPMQPIAPGLALGALPLDRSAQR